MANNMDSLETKLLGNNKRETNINKSRGRKTPTVIQPRAKGNVVKKSIINEKYTKNDSSLLFL